jgi:hypothetical protein
MADIDFITDLSDGTFRITLGDNPTAVIGNRALVNRFEITFMTKSRVFILGNKYVTDTYGGNAQKFIDKPQVLNNIQGISAAVATAIDLTVQSMLDDQPGNLPDTEKLSSAELISLDIVNDMINAVIQITPVQTEPYSVLKLNLPITRV